VSQKSLYCTAESFIWLAIVPSLENACGMEINMQIREKKVIDTDILIIGGGTAGCYAALTIAEKSDYSVVIAEKANIKRSGCLAAGVNAINAYIVEGRKPEDYVDYAKNDADGIVREDLLLTMSEKLNEVTEKMEKLGLVILKDENGKYVARGNRNIKINGENIKPILADAVKALPNVTVINRINITDYIVKDNTITGAYGFSIDEKEVDGILSGTAYTINAKKVLCATGGAAGLYRPNNPGFSRHKMWYPPFNTGAGYAMGINAGAEMTTFEMRFIALRCKDTIAPTGTIAQGVGAKQVNSHGEVYETKYGLTTSQRVYGTVRENIEGRGPCYLRTEGISEAQDESLKKAYLNMAPSQTLKWIESGKNPGEQNVEIEGTEPYIVGGHTASGYWVDTKRRTTIKNLFAAGDVAGGCPQKYVTGAMVEGEIAADTMVDELDNASVLKSGQGTVINSQMLQNGNWENCTDDGNKDDFDMKIAEYNKILNCHDNVYTTEQLEDAMQKVMDTYAGGIGSHYQFNEKQLELAKEKIEHLQILAENISADDMHELMFAYELKERLTVCLSLIEHLKARKETRWHSFDENLDYPEKSDEWLKYVNSVKKDGKIQIITRKLVERGEVYEHSNR
jgi:adenylylsulfate reductase subunit A